MAAEGKTKGWGHIKGNIKNIVTQQTAGIKVTVHQAAGLASRGVFAGNLKIQLSCLDQHYSTQSVKKGHQPSWPQGEDFVFSIHPNSNQQLELTVLQAKRFSFSKYKKIGTVKIDVRTIARNHEALADKRWFSFTPAASQIAKSASSPAKPSAPNVQSSASAPALHSDMSGSTPSQPSAPAASIGSAVDAAAAGSSRRVTRTPEQNVPGSVQQLTEANGSLVPQLQLTINYSKDALQGPFSVLCCTWNVGNANPPDDLSAWLERHHQERPHLVAVGVQECQGITKRRTTGSTNSSRRTTASKTAEEQAALQDALDEEEEEQALAHATSSITNSSAAEASLPTAAATSATADAPAGNAGSRPGSPTAAAAPGTSYVPSSPGKALVMSRSAPVHSTRRSPTIMRASKTSVRMPDEPTGLKRIFNKAQKYLAGMSPLETHIAEELQEHYVPVERRSNMGGVMLLVLVRKDVEPFIRHVYTSGENTGLAGVGWNKGGVCVGLQLGHTDICFINSHLAAHQSKTPQRNCDYSEIVEHLRGIYGADTLVSHHHVMWMGDLNYRLDWKAQATTFEESPSREDWQALVDSIKQKEFAQLFEHDQLRKEMEARRVFLGFGEGELTFAPTFKVERDRPDNSYMTKRSPAWCDRVLVRSNLPHKQASCVDYYSVPQIDTSDHKPVGALIKHHVTPYLDEHGKRKGYQVVLEVGGLQVQGDELWEALRRQEGELAVRKLKVQLVGSSLAPGVKPKHVLNVAAAAKQQGPLLGSTPEALMEAHEAAQRRKALPKKSPASGHSMIGLHALHHLGERGVHSTRAMMRSFSIKLHHRTEVAPAWKLHLQHGAVSDLDDERLLLVLRAQGKAVARGVVPLHQLVQDHYSTQPWSTISVDMELNGLPLGTLKLTARLELDGPRMAQLLPSVLDLPMHDSDSAVAGGSSSSAGPTKLRSAMSMPTMDDMALPPPDAASAKSQPLFLGAQQLIKATSS